MPDQDLSNLKRDGLDRAAKKASVANPEALPNKEAVIEAIEHNPALVREPDPEPELVAAEMPAPEPAPGEVSYQVTGPHIVLGHKPGAKFSAAIPAAQEALLIESGHIKRTESQG